MFLATEKGYRVLTTLLEKGYDNHIIAVVSFHEIEMKKDYYDDICDLCEEKNIMFYEWKSIKDSIEEIIKTNRITSCIAISWRYLLPLELNCNLEDRIIIFHDSILPKYRGFAPLVTAMLNGDSIVGVSVLYATSQADCGEIILQKTMNLSEDMYIEEVIHRMSALYSEAALDLIELLISDSIKAQEQDEADATYSIWRDDEDYWIDWNWSSVEIKRHIQALGYPFKGAKTCADNLIIRINGCELVNDMNFAIRTPGKIWSISDNQPIVVCGKGLLKITEAFDEQGIPYKFNRLRTRLR